MRKDRKAKIKAMKQALCFREAPTLVAYNPTDVQDPLSAELRRRVPALQESLVMFHNEKRKRKRNVSNSSVEPGILQNPKTRKTGGDRVAFEAEYFRKVRDA